MPVALRNRDDVSVNDLKAIAGALPVVRTPHVGNSSLYNLFAAACGFPSVLVDTNTPGRDSAYNPHLFIRDGSATILSECADPMQTLVTHLAVTNALALPHDVFHGTVVDVHLSRLQQVFPDTSIETHQTFLSRNREYVEAALEIMTDAMPEAWYRRVSCEGTLSAFRANEPTGVSCWRDVAGDVFIAPARSGWVIPNVFALMLDILIQMRDGSSREVWMLSGPDMIGYMPKLQDKLDLLYATLSRRLNLSGETVVQLVPFADFRFAVRAEHRQSLDSLLREMNADTRDRIRIGKIAASCPDLWYRTERRNHFSQHDMTSARDIYAPEEVLGMSLRACRGLWEKIRADVPKKLR